MIVILYNDVDICVSEYRMLINNITITVKYNFNIIFLRSSCRLHGNKKAFFTLVQFIVREILFTLAYDLFVLWVRNFSHDFHDCGFIHLGGHNYTTELLTVGDNGEPLSLLLLLLWSKRE